MQPSDPKERNLRWKAVYGIGLVVVLGIFLFSRWINVLNEYERAVIFWLGRLSPQPKGPGLVFIFWPFEQMVKISLRTVVLDVPPQDVITRDNVSVKVNAVVYFRVVDPAARDRRGGELPLRHEPARADHAALGARPGRARRAAVRARQAQRAAPGDHRPHTDPWGIKVSMVEVKHVDLPQEMQRAMARQAEAEREKRAKIIHAEGELQASAKLAEAAEIIVREPGDPAAPLPADA